MRLFIFVLKRTPVSRYKPADGCSNSKITSISSLFKAVQHLPDKLFLVKTVLGKELGATGVGSYAALLIVCTYHNAACFFQLIVVLLRGKLFYSVLGRVEGKGLSALAVRFPTFTVKQL